MPRHGTLKAEYFLAVVARDLNSCFRFCFDHYILALGIWAELLEVTPHHLLIGFKLSKLFVCGLIADLLDKVIGDGGSAPLLRALDEVALASRLGNLVGEEVFVTFLAEKVATASILHKIRLVVLVIADFAKSRVL
jgi:hypothetical protein